MSSSQSSQKVYSPGVKYANVIATIAVAVGILLWGILYNKLEQLDSRLRTVEQTISAIAGKPVCLDHSLQGQAGRLSAPGLIETP